MGEIKKRIKLYTVFQSSTGDRFLQHLREDIFQLAEKS